MAMTAAQAQDWPDRTVRFIVGQGAGSAQDLSARMFAEKLSKVWGQPVVIENRPGADGIVSIMAFVGARDNHTFLFTASGTFAAHPVLRVKVPYDPNDLVPIAQISTTVIAVAVPTALNVSSLDELVALAKKEPGKINLAPTPGTTEITFDNFLKTTGISMTKIPYGDITKAVTDLSENRVQVVVAGVAVVKAQVDAGRVKLIAVTNHKRAPSLPDVPTAAEAGYPSLTLDGLIGLFGPKTLPAGVADRIAKDVQDAAADTTIKARVEASGQVLTPAGPAEFGEAVAAQRRNIAETAKALNIKPVQ